MTTKKTFTLLLLAFAPSHSDLTETKGRIGDGPAFVVQYFKRMLYLTFFEKVFALLYIYASQASSYIFNRVEVKGA